MVELAAQIWRDFSVDGDPGSGAHKPVKAEIREWGTWIEDFISSPEFTTDVTIAKATPALILDKTASGQSSRVTGSLNGVLRWQVGFGNGTAEAGSNAGSDWSLDAFDDAGAFIRRALVVTRSEGVLELPAGKIKFPATQFASSDANTLDDYEEGTFTPSLSATGVTLSYASQVGTYTKIGNRVLFSIRIELNTSGNTLAGNALSLAGFPFAAAAAPTVNIWPVAFSSATTSYVQVNLQLAAAATTGTFLGSTAAAILNTTAILANGLLHATNGSILRLNGQYAA